MLELSANQATIIVVLKSIMLMNIKIWFWVVAMVTVERSVCYVHFNLSFDHLDISLNHCVSFSGLMNSAVRLK